jgi:hypothetical protein
VVYSVAAASLNIQSTQDIFRWLTSYSSPDVPRGSTWGRWEWVRIRDFAETWIHSIVGWIPLVPRFFPLRPIRFDTVFPRLAPIALVVFFSIPLLGSLRRAISPLLLWCLLGSAAYIPFIVWWDPFETKWLLVPNVFLALLAAQAWSHLAHRRWAPYVAASSAVILAASNLFTYAIPSHTRLSQDYRVADCIASHMTPSDLYIATGWDLPGYLAYKHGRDSIDLVGVSISFQFDRAGISRALRQQVEQRQEGGDVYVTEPFHYSAWQLESIKNRTGMTGRDLDRALPGKTAFECQGRPIRRVHRNSESNMTWETLGSISTTRIPAEGAVYATTKVGLSGLESGSMTIRSENGSTPPALALIENSLVQGSKVALFSQPKIQAGLLWLDGAAGRRSAIVFLNPEKTPARIDWSIVGEPGNTRTGGTVRLSPGESLARYTNEDPFVADLKSIGFLHFSSSGGVIATSVLEPAGIGQEATNTIPAIDLQSAAGMGKSLLPIVETGTGKFIRISLVNPSEDVLTGSLVVSANPPSEGQRSIPGAIPYSLRPREIWQHRLEISQERAGTGWLTVVPTRGMPPPAIAAVENRDGRSRIIIPQATMGDRLWAYAGRTHSPAEDNSRSTSSTIRILNPGSDLASARFTVGAFGSSGPLASTSLKIPGGTYAEVNIDEISPAILLPPGMHRFVEVDSGGPLVALSVLVRRFDGPHNIVLGGQSQRMPPVAYVSRIVIGGGYRTALLFGSTSPDLSNWIHFNQTSGEVLSVPLSRLLP